MVRFHEPFRIAIELLYQHAINQKLKTQTDLNLRPEAIEQALIDFRVEHHLTDPEVFEAWLISNEIDDEIFRQQLAQHLKLSQLKTRITQPRLQDYLNERRLLLDQVLLSWIRVDTKDLAKALQQQLEAGAKFARLAKAYAEKRDDSHPKRVAQGLTHFW